MDLQINRDGTFVSADLGGRIDGTNAHEFAQTVREAIEDTDTCLLIDCKDLIYISSAGLRAILMTAKLLQDRKARFALSTLSSQIMEVFQISGFDKIVAVHGTREEAVAALAG
ncbi:MAG: STAS domain-containing protein [Pseudomonadales bacterium]|nr:STAS domain-containing protein [Pseudomonadales bacterium]